MKGELIRWKNGIIMCFMTVGDYLGVRKVRGDTLMAFFLMSHMTFRARRSHTEWPFWLTPNQEGP